MKSMSQPGGEAGGRNPLADAIVRRWRSDCPSFSTMDVRDKTFVYRQGDSCQHVYHVASGYLKLVVTDKSGHGSIRMLLSSGDFFGVTSGRTRQIMQDSAVSKGTVRLYRCKADEFNSLLTTQMELTCCLLANLSDRLALAQRRNQILLYSSVESRVALLLCELAGEHGGHCPHGHEIDMRLTQQELADMVGASRPVVSTILSALRQRRIVGYTRAFICIENMTSLRQLF